MLSHHNIFFSDDYRAEFDELFVRRVPQQNPTIYVYATSRIDASQAPEGYENSFVYGVPTSSGGKGYHIVEQTNGEGCVSSLFVGSPSSGTARTKTIHS